MLTPIKQDKRFTVSKEFCGHPQARFVVRFCDKFLQSFMFATDAVNFCHTEKAKREAIISKA